MAEQIPVIGLGAGGHAKVVLDAIRAIGGYTLVGLLDPRTELHGSEVLGVPVIGGDSTLTRLYDDGVRHAFIGLGGAADTRARRRLYELAEAGGFEVITVVHPSATVSPSAKLGKGATVLAAAVINADVTTGENATVNTGAIVEHDCQLGNHVPDVATGARLASGVNVGDGAHVGAGATVIQGVAIGAAAVVGAGAVVIESVEPETVVAGVPARTLRKVEH